MSRSADMVLGVEPSLLSVFSNAVSTRAMLALIAAMAEVSAPMMLVRSVSVNFAIAVFFLYLLSLIGKGRCSCTRNHARQNPMGVTVTSHMNSSSNISLYESIFVFISSFDSFVVSPSSLYLTASGCFFRYA